MKKVMFFIALVLFICSLNLFGGGSQTPTTSAGSGPARLTVAMAENVRVSDFKNNHMTQLIEKGANVDLEFVMLPNSDYVNRINLMIMAGGTELPDVIMALTAGFSDANVLRWGLSGAIVPVTKYLKDPKLTPYLHEAMKKDDRNIFEIITSPDGEIYGFPRATGSIGNAHQPKAFYYEPWLTKLGLKVPTTTDELRTVLRAVAAGDPNGNGQRDEIGITGTFNMPDIWSLNWFQFLMNAFIYAGDTNFFVVNNGKVGAAYTDPEWREGLKYIRSLFAEGLMPSENLTQTTNDARVLLNSETQKVFLMPYADMAFVNASNSNGDLYRLLMPLKGPKGVQFTGSRPPSASVAMLVSANCKNVDAAARVGDYMMRQDITYTNRYGKEGQHWDFASNVKNHADYFPRVDLSIYPYSIMVYDDVRFWGGTAVENYSWRDAGPAFSSPSMIEGLGFPKKETPIRETLAGQARGLYANSVYHPKQVIPKLIFTENEISDVDVMMTALLTYLTESTSNFLIGNRDIDSTWNSYLNDINNIGLPKVLSTVQKVYDRMYK